MKIIEERAGLPDDVEAQEESYRNAFRVFDRDESGKISAEELRYHIVLKIHNKSVPYACLSLINLLYFPPKKLPFNHCIYCPKFWIVFNLLRYSMIYDKNVDRLIHFSHTRLYQI